MIKRTNSIFRVIEEGCECDLTYIRWTGKIDLYSPSYGVELDMMQAEELAHWLLERVREEEEDKWEN